MGLLAAGRLKYFFDEILVILTYKCITNFSGTVSTTELIQNRVARGGIRVKHRKLRLEC